MKELFTAYGISLSEEQNQKFTAFREILIAENAKKLIIRVPVIPTFNDTEEAIGSIAAFAASLGTVKEMHILPYHRIGSDKYAGLGRKYEMAHISPPSKEQMQNLLSVVEKHGLKGQIGG